MLQSKRTINNYDVAPRQAACHAFGYGEVDPSSTITNNLRFPGQYFDAETNLHYNWNRYYDPRTGRYLTPDPIGLEGGIDPFVYVENDPVNKTDREGLLGSDTVVKFLLNQVGKYLLNKSFGDQKRMDEGAELEKTILYREAQAYFSDCMGKCKTTIYICNGRQEFKQDANCVNKCLQGYDDKTKGLRYWR